MPPRSKRRSVLRRVVTRSNVNLAISLLALAVAAFAAVFTYKQSQIAERQARLHLRPELQVHMTLATQNDSVQPVVLLRNTSPFAAVSVHADTLTVYLKEASGRLAVSDVWGALGQDKDLKGHLVFERRMEPNQVVSVRVPEQFEVVGPSPCIKGLVVFVRYHHETDLTAYEQKVIFFLERRELLSEEQFKAKHPRYAGVAADVRRVPPPDYFWITPIEDDRPKASPFAPPTNMRLLHTCDA